MLKETMRISSLEAMSRGKRLPDYYERLLGWTTQKPSQTTSMDFYFHTSSLSYGMIYDEY